MGAVAYNEFGKVWLVPGDPVVVRGGLRAIGDRALFGDRKLHR
ncbi:MAG: hypothetical protein V7638_2377 [Acidobacteriota bacterium]